MDDRLTSEEQGNQEPAGTQAEARVPGNWMARNPMTTMILLAGAAIFFVVAVSVYYARREQLVPSDASALMGLGQRYYEEGRYEEAVDIARQLDERQSSYWYAEFVAGNARFRQQDYAGAAAHFARATEMNPEVPLPLLNLALMHSRMGDTRRAIELYQEVINRFDHDYPHFGDRARTALSILEGQTLRHPEAF